MSAAYKVDQFETGLNNLNDLISIICEMQNDRDIGNPDHRIDSLLWIARDLSQGVVECFEREALPR